MPEKKFEKIVTGEVKTKKSFGKSLIAGDLRDIKDSLVGDVFIPSVKRLLLDICNNGLEMLFYGNVSGRSTTQNTAKPAYSRISTQGATRITSGVSPIASAVTPSHDYENIIFDPRDFGSDQEAKAEANKVLDTLQAAIEEYDVVSLADLYEMLGWSSNYTDNKYGWFSLGNANVVQTRSGYHLHLPKAVAIT